MNSKLRVFFWLVPLPKGRYQCGYSDTLVCNIDAPPQITSNNIHKLMLEIVMLCIINGTFRIKTLCRISLDKKNAFFSSFFYCICACSIVRILVTTLWKIFWLLGTFCFDHERKMVQTAMFAVCTKHTTSGGGGSCFHIFNESENRCIKIYSIVKQCLDSSI